MDDPTIKLKKATPEEFERLLRGETVVLSLEGNESLNFLTKNESGKEIVRVSDLEVEGHTVLKGNYPYSIELIGNNKIGDVEISGEATTSSFLISGKATIGSLNIFDKAITGSFGIHGDATMGFISIYDQATTGHFSVFERATLKAFWVYREATMGAFNIFQKATMQDFRISEKATMLSFSISDRSAMGSFSVSGDATTGSVWIHDKATMVEGKLVNQGKMRSLVIKDEAVVPKWHFDGGEVVERVVLKNLKTHELCFSGSGTTFPDEIRIENVAVKALRFVDFRAATNVVITNVRPKAGGENTYLEFTRSSFQKLELIGNHFEDFDFLVFENGDLTSAFLAGTDFPAVVKTRQIPVEPDDSEEGNAEPISDTYAFDRHQAKLFFEQVKTVMLRQGNRTGAIRYQARELEQHYRLVKLWPPKSALDKFTLWFNKYSNGFGTNWLQGLVFFFGVTVLLYWLLLVATPAVEAAWPWQMNWSDFNEFAIHYFDFINPTSHIWKRWDYIYLLENGADASPEEESLRWGIKLLLLFSKIIIITIIYQIVQAFRKFGRR